MYHYLLPGGCGLPRSKQWVAALKCPLLDIPCSCSFFFSCIYLPLLLCFQTHSGAYYSNCSLVLPAGPSILQVMLSVLLLFCRLCCFPEIAAFLFFFSCVCVCVNKRFTRSLHILALFSCSHTVECSVIACWFFYSLSAFSCRILYSISIRCNAVKVMQVQSPKFIALRVPSMLRCTPAAFARASMHMRLLRLC